MIITKLFLKNFRGYNGEYNIDLSDINAFIGKNDIGKSSILEALEIFFNNKCVKIENNDANIFNDSKEVTIGCIFSNFPEEIVLDTTAITSLKDEYLLNENEKLEIHKIFDCSKKKCSCKIYARSNHPNIANANDLLNINNKELKQRIEELGINTDDVDLRSNPAIRKAIWNNFTNLQLAEKFIDLENEGAKPIYSKIKKEFPIFALFQSDRSSTDQDSEVQDPMKFAITEALKNVEDELKNVKDAVCSKALEIAKNTVTKIAEMDSTLANELNPSFKSEPSWEKLFKLTLIDEDKIPLNKRGSGVRRLILLNFFRAEAERRQKEEKSPNIIYAIEEPETSQHPDKQKLLLEALNDLSQNENCQVMLTTHVPGLAGYLPIDSLQYIDTDNQSNLRIRRGNDEVLEEIADTLGVIPDNRVKVVFCVEGPNDINFFNRISKKFNRINTSIPDIENDPRVVIIPLGGSNLKQWVDKNYLSNINRPEVHFYDCDRDDYEEACNEVNSRTNGSYAVQSGKLMLENYIHPDVVNSYFDINITYGDSEHAVDTIKNSINSDTTNTYYPINKKRLKKILNNEVVQQMTINQLRSIDADNDIESILMRISSYL